MCETVCHVSVRCCLFRVPFVSVYSNFYATDHGSCIEHRGFVSTWCNSRRDANRNPVPRVVDSSISFTRRSAAFVCKS